MAGPIPKGQLPAANTGKAGVQMDDGNLTSPENVVMSPQAALTIYKRLKHAHRQRCWNYERIQGMIDGNPPYNPREMARAGLTDMSNVNWKDGESVFSSVALAYWSLFNDVENIAEFHVDFGDDEALKAEWGRVLAEEWDKTIRSWPDFQKHMDFHQAELIKFGLSLLVWPDEDDWRFKPVNIKSFLVPDQTNNNLESLTTVIVERQYTAQFLYRVYETAKSSPSGVWNAEALGHILFMLADISDEDKKSHGISDCNDLQKYIRNGDLHYSDLYNDEITLVSLLSKEYDGKITHQMIHHKIPTEDFPYFLDRQYDDIREALVYFTYRPGEETIHGNKGLGHSIFSGVEAITQLDCSVIDQTKRAGTLIVRSGPQRGRDERQIKFVHGGVIDVGEAEIAQNSMGSNVANSVDVSRYFKGKILANNNVAGGDPAFADRNVQSVRALEQQATKEARVQKNQIAHYYATLDHLFREIVRKMLRSTRGSAGWEYVAIWKERSIARGVPEEFFEVGKAKILPNGLPDYLDITASRSAGSGSQIADQIEMREMMGILPTMGERGRTRILKDFIAAFRGFRYVDRYFPDEDQMRQPTGDDTIASIENNQLTDGKQIVVSPDNNHAVHAPAHVRMMSEWMQLYQQNPEAQFDRNTNLLQKVDDVFAVAGPHLVGHLFFLQNDPTRKSLFQELNAEWAVLANFGDMIANNAGKQREAEARREQQAAQAQAEQDAQNTPEHIKARGDIALKDQKMQAGIERDRVRDSNKFLLERENIRRKTELDRLKASGELAIKAQKELSDVNKE